MNRASTRGEPPDREPPEREPRRETALERNLLALFARAYRPVDIRSGFEREVQRSAAARLQSAAKPRARPLVLALAAAASFVLAWFALGAWQRSDAARERILARGEVAVRASGAPWRSLGPATPGSDAPAAVRLGPAALELAVPERAAAAVAWDALGGGAVAVLGPARARFVPAGRGADVELGAAALSARAYHGRIQGPFGRLDLSAADLDLACDDSGGVRALLLAGRARLEARDGRRIDLARGVRFDTHAPTVSAVGTEPAGAPSSAAVEPAARTPATPAGASPPGNEPPSGAALAGTVRDAAGRTVTDFQVILLRELELPRTANARARRFADAGGAFEFAAPGRGASTVFVQAEGFALWTQEHVQLGALPVRLDVVLERGATVAGRVVDARTGAPVSGALVVSESDVPTSLLPFDFDACPENPAALARTDAEGRFRLEHLASGTTVLRARAAGFAPAWSTPFAPVDRADAPPGIPGDGAEELRLELSPGGSVSGRVEREDGSAWAGAGLIAMPQVAVFGLPRRSYGITLADAGGQYRIDDLPPGACVVVRVDLTGETSPASGDEHAERQDAAGTEVREALVRAGGNAVVDFLAPPRGSRLAGRILRAGGEPLASATVSIIPILPEPDASGASGAVPDAWRSQLCGVDGSFEFTDVRPGRYQVFLGVRSPMDVVIVDTVDVEAAANVDRVILAPALELSGSARSAADGRPARFAWVVVLQETGPDERVFAAKVQADVDGAWRVPYLRPGRYLVRVYPGDGLAFAGRDGLELATGVAPAPVDFELHPGAAVLLSVRDAAGAPVAGAEVRVRDEQGLEYEPARVSRTDAQGTLALEGLPAGRLRISVRAGDGASALQDCVADPSAPLQLELRLAPQDVRGK